jgi:hypothetical protein
MRTLVCVAALCFAVRAGAQDSSAYRELRIRASLVSNPEAGAISSDWKPGVGKQIDVATPLAVGELAVSVGRIHYKPLTGKPSYAATVFTFAWLTPEVSVSRARLSAGLRLSDYRMDFDDPSLVGGLRTEEEVMPGVIAKGRLAIGRRVSLVGDASYAILMLGHHTRMTLLTAGAEYALPTPGWLRDIMR